MCNDYRLTVDAASLLAELQATGLRIDVLEGTPNIAARDDIRITDVAPIVRSIEGERGTGELVNRRWSWPSPNGKPVYNFRSEGRTFTSGRCLILADGFYGCCQTNANQSPLDAGVAMRRSLQATSNCHSAIAAERRSL